MFVNLVWVWVPGSGEDLRNWSSVVGGAWGFDCGCNHARRPGRGRGEHGRFWGELGGLGVLGACSGVFGRVRGGLGVFGGGWWGFCNCKTLNPKP